MPSPLPRMTGPSRLELPQDLRRHVSEVLARLVTSSWLIRWPASAASTTSGLLRPVAAARGGGVEKGDQLVRIVHPAGLQQCAGSARRVPGPGSCGAGCGGRPPGPASNRCLRRQGGSPSRRPVLRHRTVPPQAAEPVPAMTATPVLAPPAASSSRESWTTVIPAPGTCGSMRAARAAASSSVSMPPAPA